MLNRLRAWLPQGRTLPEEVWERRHRVLLGLLWANAAGLFVYGIVQGYGVRHTFIDVALIILPGLFGTLVKSRHARAAWVSIGLITCAAVMVHLSKGLIEAHFYFFVLIVVLTLYEDWVPLLVALAYVVFHHGVMGTVAPETVYDHGDAVDHPWKWAGIHAGFVLAAAVAAIAAWRLNEDVRHRLTGVVASSGDAIVELDLDGLISAWNPAAAAMLGYSADEVVGEPVSILHSEGQSGELGNLVGAAVAERSTDPIETVLGTKDGDGVPVSLRVSPIRDVGERLIGTSLVARDIRDRRRAEAAKARAESYRAVQLEAAGILAESGTVEETMPRVLDALGRGFSWEVGVHWRLEEGLLNCAATWHLPNRRFDDVVADDFEARVEAVELDAGEGLLGHVVSAGEPAWMENVAADRTFPPGKTADELGIRGVVAVPLVREDEVIGVIEFFASSLKPPDAELMQTLSVISSQVGQFVARKQAEQEAERLKDEFFGLVSHELRTPLTSVIGYTDMLAKMEAEQLSQRGQKMVEVISRNAKRELRLVGDLLLLVRIEAGKFEIEHGEVDLPSVVEESVQAVTITAEQAEVVLSLQADPVPPFDGDAERIGQAIDNLLTNAIKFTPEGGNVEVRVSNQGDRAVVEVQDSGVGIPPEDQVRLFDRLYRASSATKNHVPGTGLGLTIVKAIAEAHHGRVEVESEAGKGSTFRIELPLTPVGSNGSNGAGALQGAATNGAGPAPARTA
jgi:PAS domain S-box-containing protein